MEKTLLFCFPYAGGSSAIYKKWSKILLPSIELVPVELSGRGKRLQSGLYKDFSELLEDVQQIVMHERIMEKVPFALFGHSMGGLIAYELYFRLREHNYEPVHIFISSLRCLIQTKNLFGKYHLLADDEFLAEINKIGGNLEILQSNERIRNIYLPILKNDFKVMAMYEIPSRGNINCDLSILYGSREESKSGIKGWESVSDKKCSFYEFNGDHFFINACPKEIVEIINRTLAGPELK